MSDAMSTPDSPSSPIVPGKTLEEKIEEQQEILRQLIANGEEMSDAAMVANRTIVNLKGHLACLAPVRTLGSVTRTKDSEGAEDKAVTSFVKQNGKLKFYEGVDPIVFWSDFAKALNTPLLRAHSVLLLEHCLKTRAHSEAFFTAVSHASQQVDFDLEKLKALFLQQYSGVYWKTKALNRYWNIGYVEGEEVVTFVDRFHQAGTHAGVDMSSTGPESRQVKETLIAKVPDSVKRLLGAKSVDDFPSCDDLIAFLKTFQGIPADGKYCYENHCPRCLHLARTKCVNPACGFEHSLPPTLAGRRREKRSSPEAPPNSPPLKRREIPSKVTTPCKFCGVPWVTGHHKVCSKRPIRTEEPRRFGQIIRLETPEEMEASESFDLSVVEQAFRMVADETLGFVGLYTVEGKPARCLVDSGASQSFMDPAFAEALGLKVQELKTPVNFVMALGGVTQAVTRCVENVGIVSHTGGTTKGRFFIAPLKEDVVIGRDMFPGLRIFLAGVSTRCSGPDPPPSPEPSTEQVKGRPEATMNELLSVNEDDRELYLCTVQELSVRGEQMLQSLLHVNEGLTGFCSHPDAVITIDTGSSVPSFRRQYAVPEKLKPVVTNQIKEWLAEGLVRAHNESTDYNNPLLVVPKYDLQRRVKAWRVCIDPRALNNQIRSVNYPLPLIENLFEQFRGSIVFSKLDLRKGFHQFRVRDEDQVKTSFTWHYQQYCFTGAPFGFKHVPSVFQKVMAQIFRGMEPFVVIYVDDIIIHSSSLAEHKEHLEKVLARLNEVNLRVQRSKCELWKTSLIVLGYQISAQGIQVASEKLESIRAWTPPQTGKDLERHLGFFNYFRKIIPMYADLFAPLEGLRKNQTIDWTPSHQAIYDSALEILSSDLVLSYPDFSLPFFVGTDASDHGIAAVLYQEVGEVRKYVKLASRALRGAEGSSYGATKRELLAIVFALKEFRQYLWGRRFTLRTDHKALTYLFTQKAPNQMIQGWFETLLDFDFQIEHVPGILNVLPDRLSRLYRTPRLERHQFKQLSAAAGNTEAVQAGEGIPLVQEDALALVMDREHRASLLESAHLKGHFGAKAIERSIHGLGKTWPSLRADAQECVARCMQCQRFNIGRHGFHPLKNYEAALPFDHVCMDVKQMIRTPNGNVCYLLVVDVFTRFVFLRVLKEHSAYAVAQELLDIFCTVGFPRIVTSDNGTEFVNQIMAEVIRVSGIDHRLISAYHHRGNGVAERSIRTTSQTIYKLLEGQVNLWDRYIPATQLYANLKVAEVTGSTPYSLVFARKANELEDYSASVENPFSVEKLRERLNYMNLLVFPAIVQKSKATHQKRNEYFNKRNHIVVDKFIPGAVVMIRDETRGDKMTPVYEGAFTIVRRNAGGAYVLKNVLGEEFVRPPNVLKLAHPDLALPGVPGVAAEVDRILDHRTVEGSTELEYLVHWKQQSSERDQWVKHSDFNDVGPVLHYHKCLSDGKDIHREVKSRRDKYNKAQEPRRRNKRQRVPVESVERVVQLNAIPSTGEIQADQTGSEEVVMIPKNLNFDSGGDKWVKKSGSNSRRKPHVPGAFKE